MKVRLSSENLCTNGPCLNEFKWTKLHEKAARSAGVNSSTRKIQSSKQEWKEENIILKKKKGIVKWVGVKFWTKFDRQMTSFFVRQRYITIELLTVWVFIEENQCYENCISSWIINNVATLNKLNIKKIATKLFEMFKNFKNSTNVISNVETRDWFIRTAPDSGNIFKMRHRTCSTVTPVHDRNVRLRLGINLWTQRFFFSLFFLYFVFFFDIVY